MHLLRRSSSVLFFLNFVWLPAFAGVTIPDRTTEFKSATGILAAVFYQTAGYEGITEPRLLLSVKKHDGVIVPVILTGNDILIGTSFITAVGKNITIKSNGVGDSPFSIELSP